jgi:hypothetical protein
MSYAYLYCLNTSVVCLFVFFIHYSYLNNAQYSCLNKYFLWNNMFFMDLEQTHEACNFVMYHCLNEFLLPLIYGLEIIITIKVIIFFGKSTRWPFSKIHHGFYMFRVKFKSSFASILKVLTLQTIIGLRNVQFCYKEMLNLHDWLFHDFAHLVPFFFSNQKIVIKYQNPFHFNILGFKTHYSNLLVLHSYFSFAWALWCWFVI